MIFKRLTQDELFLLEILEHPVWCAQFLREEVEHNWVLTDYQVEVLSDCNNFVSFRAGRSVGKCLDKNSRLLNVATGDYKTIEEYFILNEDLFVPAIDEETFKQVSSEATITDNGIKERMEVRTVLGKETIVTLEHPFLTPAGWVNAENLTVNTYIAIPRELPFFGEDSSYSEVDLKVLAHFIAEGTRNTGLLSSAELEIETDLQKYIEEHGGTLYKYTPKEGDCLQYNFTDCSDYRDMLSKLDLLDKYSHEKFIPEFVFRLPKDKLVIFLSRLFGGDGWNTGDEVGYSSSSKELAFGVKHLLLRFGIQGSISKKKTYKRDNWNISLSGTDASLFMQEIGFYTERKNIPVSKKNSTSDVLPLPNYRDYKQHQKSERWTRPLRYYPTIRKTSEIVNPDAQLERFRQVRWVKITSLIPMGEGQTYSIEVEKYHTLVADDIYSHNSEALIDKLVYYAINNFFDTPIVAVLTPNRVHLTPLWRKLVRWLSLHPFLKHYKNTINSQTFDIGFVNGVTIDCRIAGIQATGTSVIGLHTPVLVVDEAGFFPWTVWVELMPTINTWETGYQIYVCGTPSGERENNVLFYTDQISSQYNTHRVSAFDNPRYSEEAKQRDKEQYGGEDSDDYKRLVLGEHASPVIRIFSRDTIPVSPFKMFTGTLTKDDLENDPLKFKRLLKALPRVSGPVAAGVDLGYSDPTIISFFERVDNVWRNFARITLQNIEYPKQLKFIDELDTIYRFYFLAIDEGHAGMAVTQELTSEKFKHKNFRERLVSVNFGQSIELGVDLDGNPLKSYVKNISVEKLRFLMDNKQVLFATRDDALLSELERVESSRTQSNRTIYRVRTRGGSLRGDDHIFASLLCFSYAMYLEQDLKRETKAIRLIGATWAH